MERRVGGIAAHPACRTGQGAAIVDSVGPDRRRWKRQRKNLADHLRDQPDASLADIAFTLQVGRRPFEHRRIIVSRDVPDAVAALDANDPNRTATPKIANPPVAFLFPGQGAQFVRMAAETYGGEPVFPPHSTSAPNRFGRIWASTFVRPFIHRLRPKRKPRNGCGKPRLRNRRCSRSNTALARLWISWGVRPAAMFGHSIGEYVAACLAGVFTLEDALMLVALRGRLIQSMPPGSMLAVRMAEADVVPLLGPELALAAMNGPSQCVVSGSSKRSRCCKSG